MVSQQQIFVPPGPLITPVLFLVFNRPDTARQVFESIRKAKPSRLFVAADGPRQNNVGEAERCAEVRRMVDKEVDWPCEVHRLYRDMNLGCKVAVSTAIDWFFSNIEEGIILEDDCLPSQSFFWFCQDLLEHYRHDNRMMMVSGINKLGTWKEGIFDYFFSFGGIWGWATWRRAWKHFDVGMTLWRDKNAKDSVRYTLDDQAEFERIKGTFDRVIQGKLDTWDYQWLFAMLINSGLSAIPSKNLICNIGIGTEATHLLRGNAILSRMIETRYEMKFPLRYNEFIVPDMDYTRLRYHIDQAYDPRKIEIKKRLFGPAGQLIQIMRKLAIR